MHLKQKTIRFRVYIMRMPRLLKNGARYHVTARANGKEFIFSGKRSKELFLLIVKRAKRHYSFSIENFSVMGNHFHFIIRPHSRESLSKIMQWILSVFAVAFNKQRGKCGHVWGERFFSRVLDSLKEFSEVFAYIRDNPVKANLVQKPWEWEYGGQAHFMDKNFSIIKKPNPIVERLFMQSHA